MKLLSLCRAATFAMLIAMGWSTSAAFASATDMPLRKSAYASVTTDPAAETAPERPDESFEPTLPASAGIISASSHAFARAFNVPAFNIARTVKQSMPVYGNVIDNSTWSSYNPKYNVSSLPTDGTSTTLTVIKQNSNMNGVGGAVYADGKYYVIDYVRFGSSIFPTVYVYNTETWEQINDFDCDDSHAVSTDMDYDETTGKIYGCFQASGGVRDFGTIDMTDGGKVTVIKTLDISWNAMAFNAQGQLYVIDKEGDLYTVNKTNGDMTKIGATGLKPYYTASAAFDKRTGRLYYTYAPEDNACGLYEINTTTGAATKLYDYANQEHVVGLWVPLPLAEDEAPAAVTEITPEFIKGALSGTVKFNAPSLSFMGEQPLSGQLTYTVTANGQQVATGTTTPGAATTAGVTVPAAGLYEIRVTTANSFGPSPVYKTSFWIGNDTPKDIKSVKLDYSNGTFSLTWNAATEAVNGGYVDPEAVTYKVTRYPEAKVVAEALKTTSFTETITEPEGLTTFYYTVSAAYAGTETGATASNRFTVGNILPPYSQDFSDSQAIDVFTTIDVDADGRNWVAYNGAVRSRYNTRNATDNWLITPAVRLQGGMQYEFSFDSRANSTRYTSFMEVWFGTAPNVEGMTTQLLDKTEVKLTTMERYSFKVNVETDGLYYFAVHDCSNTNGDYLYVDNMEISAGKDANVPAAPAALKATPDYNGSLSMAISCTLPATNIAGKALSSLTKAELRRDGEIINTVSNPAPGADFSYTDTDSRLTEGRHTYTVLAYNESGAGDSISATPYVGINAPTEPTALNLIETSKLGEVTLSWDTPGTDIDGNPLNPEFVSYIIMGVVNGEAQVLARNVKGNSWTTQAVAADATEQDFVFYGISAETKGGISDPAVSPVIAAGPAYTGAFAESFANATMARKWAENTIQGKGSWQLMEETTFSTMGSQDADNGYICYRASAQKEISRLLSGKIFISNEKNPTLSFYFHPLSGSTNAISVIVLDAGTETTVKSFTLADGQGEWDKISVDLGAYKGKEIQFAIEVTVNMHLNTSFDNFAIEYREDHDLSVASLNVPAEFNIGTPGTVAVNVANIGGTDASAFSVDLFLNGNKIDSKQVGSLARDTDTTVEFQPQLTVLTDESLSFHAVVNYDLDRNLANNTSTTVTSVLRMPRLAWVTDLAASVANGGVNLTWSAPDMLAMPSEQTTDDFEAYSPYIIDHIGAWTTIDVDQSVTYGAGDVSYDNKTTPKAYMVFGDKTKFPNTSFNAHSGEKFLACFGAAAVEHNDDWLISPRLNGKAQTISFYAKTYNTNEGYEKFEVLYSTSAGIATEQFIKLADSGDVPGAWTPFRYELPAGATYFAIRCVSAKAYILMIDDITYTPSSVDEATLIGYNIYRDSEKINTEPVTGTTFADVNAPEGKPVYVVTAVYTEGESRPSNTASPVTTGINGIESTTGITIATDARNIIVTNATGMQVTVYATDGRIIHNAQGTADTIIPVGAPGIYVVKAGKTIAKVAIR